jgi:alpha-glucuronidase
MDLNINNADNTLINNLNLSENNTYQIEEKYGTDISKLPDILY